MKNESFLVRSIKKILHIPTKIPYFVQLDVTNACNLNCGMCPRHFVDVPHTHIKYDTFKEIVDNLTGVEEISLVGMGEPFTFPKIFDAIRYCKSKGLVVKVTTNGLMIRNDKRIEEIVKSGLDTISFSVESITDSDVENKSHDNQETLDIIKKIIEKKESLNSETPTIGIQSVLMKNNEQDIFDIIEWSAHNKVDRVNILRTALYFDIGVERPDRNEEKVIFKKFDKLRKKYSHMRIDCLQDKFYNGWKGFLYKYFKYFFRLDSFCIRLIDYPYIDQKGNMIPCCVLPDVKFGNVLEDDLKDVWLSKKFSNFRKNHNSHEICSKCDNWRIKQVL